MGLVMHFISKSLVALAVGALITSTASASVGPTFPTRGMPAPRDLGSVDSATVTREMSVTLPLKLRDVPAAEALLKSLSDKSSANYHHFLNPQEFREKFAQSDEVAETVAASLSVYGLTAVRSGASTMRVVGSIADIQRAFGVSLHQYEVPAQESVPALSFMAPASKPSIPAEISAYVGNVIGLSTRPHFVPHSLRIPTKLLAGKGGHAAPASSGLVNSPGSLTVADFTKYYNANPLAAKNITGEGRTLGIVTLAAFTQRDVYNYWKDVGVKAKSNRIKVVNVDGGPGKPSDAAGSVETTLDVEQSGGVAPRANIIVYQAPNTNQAYLDAFVSAVESNKADSISTSWGEWEWFDNLTNNPVADPYTGKTVSFTAALHEVLLQAALQGQSVIAASGDAGAYDANRSLTLPSYSLTLSVDSPASDSFITAAGGTTLAGTQTFTLPKGPLSITIPHERAWSWDYLEPLCADLGLTNLDCGIFPVGAGGGVSFEYPLPFYQRGIHGIQKTQPDQALVDETTIPPQTLVEIPAGYAGRNVPDVSANADPQTGYVVYYTSDQTGFSKATFYGGTSFVSPQLNGVVGLLGEYVHGRVGLLNVALYDFVKSGTAYGDKDAPLKVIKYGNNDFYKARDGYSPAVGLGTLDIANFAEALKTGH